MEKDLFKNTTLIKLFSIIIGDGSKFKAEHQFFNIACLLGIAFYSFFIIINIIFKIDITLTMVKLFGIVACIVLYYYSRFKYVFSLTSFIFFLVILFSYIYIGIKNGGVTGGIAPIYIAVLAFMLFITEGVKKVILLGIWFLSITSLFVLEFYKPGIITPYSNLTQKYIDIYLGYLSGIVMIAFVVTTVKKLYKKEKLNFEELVKKYRSNGFELKEIVNRNKMLLSVRERDICKLILKGLTNKEIAGDRHISVGTVKSHINKIYKKLGASNRIEVMNHLEKI